MKTKVVISHLSVPTVFAVCVFIYALNREPISLNMLVSVLFGGILFYSAPHVLWAVIVAIGKITNQIAHAGFIASTVAMFLIASAWFFPGDRSGLPMQWMVYWPLALILQITLAGSIALFKRIKAENELRR